MDQGVLLDVLEQTWPQAATARAGPWTIRQGMGGGKRVSAATAEAAVSPPDLKTAEAAMVALDQTPLFMIRDGEDALDTMLAAAGYAIIDPVVLYSAPLALLTSTPVPPVSSFCIWPPLAIMADLWAAGGIGPARLAVMDRAEGVKTTLLARWSDQPAGVAFVAIHRNVAMIHAIEVAPGHRRKGVGANIVRAAAHWAQDRGATHLTLAVTRANAAGNALYSSLGMQVVGQYHYRIK